MTEKQRHISLRVKAFLVMLLALLGAAGIYYLSNLAINAGIDRWYMADERVERRNDAQVERLRQFAAENNVRADDTEALEQWAQKHYAYVLILNEDNTALEIGWWGLCSLSVLDAPEQFRQTHGDAMRQVTFANGEYSVLMEDYTDYKLYNSISAVSYVLASAYMLLVVLIYQEHTTHRMVALSKEIRCVSAGDLQREIPVKGHDELAAVAADVNLMRSSIVEQMRSEQRAWQANSDLIKSMSHDVRNPLTTLMGYLDLALAADDLPEDVREYLQISSGKAGQLKDLTDEMFQYFLVFGSPDLQMNFEILDAAEVLNQMLGEHLLELEHNGYMVRTAWLDEPGSIRVDTLQLSRVFDNLFSNIQKYADPSKPVEMNVRREGSRVRVLLKNEIAGGAQERESNGIGLKSCEKMLSQMGGSFQVTRGRQKFTAILTLPLAAEQELQL